MVPSLEEASSARARRPPPRQCRSARRAVDVAGQAIQPVEPFAKVGAAINTHSLIPAITPSMSEAYIGDRLLRRAVRQRSSALLVLASCALILFQALWHGHLTGIDEYDDSVYFGAADGLVHGVLPYSDYGFIQPPFVAVMLAPFAFAARFVGTGHAFEAARLFIGAVAIANVALVGRLLRARPKAEIAFGMAIMAFYPGAYTSAQTVLIEPLLTLLCLLAFTALFENQNFTSSPTRQLVAGGLLGLGVSTKIWALIPVTVVAFALWRARRSGLGGRPWRRVLLAVCGGFALVCVPMAAAAPWTFLRSVVFVQAIRPAGGYSWPTRLADVAGVHGITQALSPSKWAPAVAYVVLIGVGLLLAMACLTSKPKEPRGNTLEAVANWTAALTAVSFFAAPTYYYHYSGFLAPFLALASTRLLARLMAARRAEHCPAFGETRRRSPIASLRPGGAVGRRASAILMTLLVGVVASDVVNVARAPSPPHVTAAFRRALPGHGCVLYLQPSLGLLTNRFTASQTRCAHVIDYFGEERLLNQGRSQDATDLEQPDLQKRLLELVTASDVIVTGVTSTSWGNAVESYVKHNFTSTTVPEQQSTIYVRTLP